MIATIAHQPTPMSRAPKMSNHCFIFNRSHWQWTLSFSSLKIPHFLSFSPYKIVRSPVVGWAVAQNRFDVALHFELAIMLDFRYDMEWRRACANNNKITRYQYYPFAATVTTTTTTSARYRIVCRNICNTYFVPVTQHRSHYFQILSWKCFIRGEIAICTVITIRYSQRCALNEMGASSFRGDHFAWTTFSPHFQQPANGLHGHRLLLTIHRWVLDLPASQTSLWPPRAIRWLGVLLSGRPRWLGALPSHAPKCKWTFIILYHSVGLHNFYTI